MSFKHMKIYPSIERYPHLIQVFIAGFEQIAVVMYIMFKTYELHDGK